MMPPSRLDAAAARFSLAWTVAVVTCVGAIEPAAAMVCSWNLDLYGHRGGSVQHPENSLEAVRSNADTGATAVELDVRRLGDGTLVAFHDAEWVAGDGSVWPLREATRSSLEGWMLANGERVPLWREAVTAAVEAGLGVLADIKSESGDEAITVQTAVAEALAAGAQVEVLAFDRAELRACAALRTVTCVAGFWHRPNNFDLEAVADDGAVATSGSMEYASSHLAHLMRESGMRPGASVNGDYGAIKGLLSQGYERIMVTDLPLGLAEMARICPGGQ